MDNANQLSILDVIEEKRRAEKPYCNGMGEPLPWEDDEYHRLNEKQQQ